MALKEEESEEFERHGFERRRVSSKNGRRRDREKQRSEREGERMGEKREKRERSRANAVAWATPPRPCNCSELGGKSLWERPRLRLADAIV